MKELQSQLQKPSEPNQDIIGDFLEFISRGSINAFEIRAIPSYVEYTHKRYELNLVQELSRRFPEVIVTDSYNRDLFRIPEYDLQFQFDVTNVVKAVVIDAIATKMYEMQYSFSFDDPVSVTLTDQYGDCNYAETDSVFESFCLLVIKEVPAPKTEHAE